jgi:hypothetical protein
MSELVLECSEGIVVMRASMLDPGHVFVLRERPSKDVALECSLTSLKLPAFALREVLVLGGPRR